MDWEDPFDPVVVTLDEVVNGERDVLLVMHEEGHGGWQFYDDEDVTGRSPSIVPKEVLLELDQSLAEVTDMSVGWLARRPARGQAWVREPIRAPATGA